MVGLRRGSPPRLAHGLRFPSPPHVGACGNWESQGLSERSITSRNELLERKYQGGSCTIEQDEAVDLILKKRTDMNRALIFESGWLDIEPSYRDADWDVTYDKPGYSESYAARFVFSRKPAK